MFVSVFTKLETTPDQDAESQVSGDKARDSDNKALDATAANCSFLTYGHYISGLCTYYGSCRVESVDYMYRGACGELSLCALGAKEDTG